MRGKIITGIDVGTSAIRVVVCLHKRGEKKPYVLAMVSKISRGLRHGYVINFNEALNSVREALIEAEQLSGVKINYAYLAVGGIGIGSFTNSSSIAISRADMEVSDFDIRRAIETSEKNPKYALNSHILQAVPIGYKVDGKQTFSKPNRIKGEVLEVKTFFITCINQHLNDLMSVIEKTGVIIEDVVSSPIAASFVVLNNIQKTAGCLLANIGAETISIVVFEEGVPVSLKIFSMGSIDITNDIALGLKISLEEAEKLKTTQNKPGAIKKKLEEIINARVSEIIEIIQAHLKKIGKDRLLPAGVVIIGGGSQVAGLEILAKEILGLPATVATLSILYSKDEDVVKKTVDSSWAVSYGLCMLGIDTDDNMSTGIRFFKKTTNKIGRWLKQFLP